jgi:phospholipase/carboxylesterase
MLSCIQLNASSQKSACVIWLHGLGADGFDFEPVVEMLNLPHIHFMLPHAPYKKITMNNGYEMRAWYDLFGLNKDSPQDAVGIEASQVEIEALIAHAIALSIPSNRIALAGFSQGGAIALHTALRHKQTLAGVLALSTYLPLKSTLPAQKSVANQSIPIFMAHGKADEVIRIETAQSSHQQLLDSGYEVEWREYSMAHSVNADEIADIRQFLLKILP